MPRFYVRVDKEYFDFSCGHFLLFADRTREPMHGHNYRCYVEVEGRLSSDDMVLNYIHFKPMVKRICDELNHRTLLPLKNEDLKVWRDEKQAYAEYHDGSKFMFPIQDCILMDEHNTSTEILARHIWRRIEAELRAAGELERMTAMRVGIEEAPGQMSWYEAEFEA
ncbi:MAG: 6-carboxytetrahydropterin synthase [Planctomycetes bacterium]|nr:6-carboxytetrahydropterin synthase [Planctomycetota bacterium]